MAIYNVAAEICGGRQHCSLCQHVSNACAQQSPGILVKHSFGFGAAGAGPVVTIAAVFAVHSFLLNEVKALEERDLAIFASSWRGRRGTGHLAGAR